MTFTLSGRSEANLLGVHPDMVAVVRHAIERTRVDFGVWEGVRDMDRQRALVARGSSRTMDSMHLLQPDGFGHAVDLVAAGDLDGDGDIDAQDRAIVWDRVWYCQIAEAVLWSAGRLGVRVAWGGAWKSFFDGPHFELVA